MRIGIVTDNYFPSVGGTEISIWNYTQQLQSQGHTVFVFCPSLGRKNPKRPRPSTVRLPSIRRIYPDHPLLLVYPGITKKFRRYNLDVLHSQTPISAPYVAEYISRKLRIPHVHTMHTLIPEQVRRGSARLGKTFVLYFLQSLILGSFRRPENYLLQDEKQTLAIKVRLSWIYMLRLIRFPYRLIVPSRHVKEILQARGYSGPVELLPTFSCMDISAERHHRYLAQKHQCNILYVGRLDIEKRPQVVIDAVHLLPETLKWHLTIVGTGTQRAKLRRLVKKYKLERHVTFAGKLSQKEIARQLERSDIFVMPSYRFDTQAIVLLEACSARLPIVYCDNNLSVGVERRNSILTKPFASSIAAGIEKLLRDERLRKRLSRGSLDIEKKYLPGKLTRKLLSIYRRAINDYQQEEAAANTIPVAYSDVE